MNDLIRPSLYGAWQNILPVVPHEGDCRSWDIVGPVCETGDFLGKDRTLALTQGDLLAVCGAGAYGFAMASKYNRRNRKIGRASCRERVCQNGSISVVPVSVNKKQYQKI